MWTRGVCRRRVPAVLLAALLAATGLPGLTWAQARPDLQITFDKLVPPNVEHTMTFEVKNVGTARSTPIQALIQTVSGGPANVSRPDVPSLAPGESHTLFYGIGSCDGQVVRATVNDPNDFPSANDRAEKVCPSKPKPQPGGGPNPSDQVIENIEFPSSIYDPIPEEPVPQHLQLGTHLLGEPPFYPSYVRRHGINWTDEGPFTCGAFGSDHRDASVGWEYVDRDGCNKNWVYQLIVDFDLSWLRDLDQKLIYKAELLFDEQGLLARNNDGDAIPLGTCSGKLGLAPRGWQDVVARTSNVALLTTEATTGDRLPGRWDGSVYKGGWDVTEDVRSAIRTDLPPDQQWHGLVLHGANEYVGAESDGACLSQVSNIRLHLHYTVVKR